MKDALKINKILEINNHPTGIQEPRLRQYIHKLLVSIYGEKKAVNPITRGLKGEAKKMAKSIEHAINQFLETPGMNAGKRWNNNDETLLIQAYDNSIPLEVIGYNLGRHPSALKIRLGHIQKKRKAGKFSNEEKRELIKLYNDGYSLHKIGTMLNRKHNSIMGSLVSLPGFPGKIPTSALESYPIKNTKLKPPEFKFVQEAVKIHGKKYDYSFAEKDKIRVICSKHGVFTQSQIEHLKGSGCPKCVDTEADDKSGQILLLAMKGYSVDQISDQTGYGLRYIDEYIEKKGKKGEWTKLLYDNYEKFIEETLQTDSLNEAHIQHHISVEKQQEALRKQIETEIKDPESRTSELKATYIKCTKKLDNSIKHELMFEVFTVVNAFLNTGGGVLIIGVEDNSKEIIGLEFDEYAYKGKDPDERYKKILRSDLKKYLKNTEGTVKIDVISFPDSNKIDKKICRLEVSASSKPSYIRYGEYNNKKSLPSEMTYFYRRSGQDCIPLWGEEISDYINQHWSDIT